MCDSDTMDIISLTVKTQDRYNVSLKALIIKDYHRSNQLLAYSLRTLTMKYFWIGVHHYHKISFSAHSVICKNKYCYMNTINEHNIIWIVKGHFTYLEHDGHTNMNLCLIKIHLFLKITQLTNWITYCHKKYFKMMQFDW